MSSAFPLRSQSPQSTTLIAIIVSPLRPWIIERYMTSHSRSMASGSLPTSSGLSAVSMTNASLREHGPDSPTTPSSVCISRNTARMA